MDWTTIRVLTDNLGELLGQYERREHIDAENKNPLDFEPLKATWWIGIRSVSTSLTLALNVSTSDLEYIVERGECWGRTEKTVKYAESLVAVSRKLLADLDAARTVARNGDAVIAAAP